MNDADDEFIKLRETHVPLDYEDRAVWYGCVPVSGLGVIVPFSNIHSFIYVINLLIHNHIINNNSNNKNHTSNTN